MLLIHYLERRLRRARAPPTPSREPRREQIALLAGLHGEAVLGHCAGAVGMARKAGSFQLGQLAPFVRR